MKDSCNILDPHLEKLRKNYATLVENMENIGIFLGKWFAANFSVYSSAYDSWLGKGRCLTGLTRNTQSSSS